MIIKIDDLRGPEIYELLQEHLRDMALHSPPESVHALDIEALRRPEITFWTAAWEGGELPGAAELLKSSILNMPRSSRCEPLLLI